MAYGDRTNTVVQEFNLTCHTHPGGGKANYQPGENDWGFLKTQSQKLDGLLDFSNFFVDQMCKVRRAIQDLDEKVSEIQDDVALTQTAIGELTTKQAKIKSSLSKLSKVCAEGSVKDEKSSKKKKDSDSEVEVVEVLDDGAYLFPSKNKWRMMCPHVSESHQFRNRCFSKSFKVGRFEIVVFRNC